MSYFCFRRFLFLIIFALFVLSAGNAQGLYKSASRNPDKSLFGKTGKRADKSKIKEPRAVKNAKRKQEKNEKKRKKEYKKFVEQSRKRSYEIQSPEVRARMIRNLKDTEQKNKEKKKKVRENTRKAAKKYN